LIGRAGVAKRWPIPAVALVPTTLLAAAEIALLLADANDPGAGALNGLAVIGYYVAFFVYLAAWPISLVAIWALRRWVDAHERRRSAEAE
jgi:hypothetical protein